MKKEKLFGIFGLVAAWVLSAVTGNPGFAMAVTNITDALEYGEGTGTVASGGDGITDPNDGKALEGAVKTIPEDKGGLAQQGNGASASALDDAGMLDRSKRIKTKVIEYHAHKYPFYSRIMTRAQQIQVKGKKEAEYPEVGEMKLEAYTIGAIVENSSTLEVTLPVAKADSPIFQPKSTIIVYQDGYKWTGTANVVDGSLLNLYVTGKDSSTGQPKVIALNGKTNGNGEIYVPSISSGTRVVVAAPALNESEVEVAPDNLIPTMKSAYLQKKAYAVEMTDFFKDADKDADWGSNNIKRQALDTYKKKYTTTTFFSVKNKWYSPDSKGRPRLNYSQQGVMQMLRMGYQIASTLTYSDLIGICKMLFTKWTDASEIDVFCGSTFIEQLLNLDFGKKTPILYVKDKDLKIDIATFECTFGKLNFLHEPTLSEHHLDAAAIAIPTSDCIHLYRTNGVTYNIDGKKGEGGVVEESTTSYFIQDDCFIVPTMCSMLIGPEDVFSYGITTMEDKIVSVSELPASATSGDIIYLVAPDSYTVTTGTSPNTTTTTYNLGVGAYKYDGTYWQPYTREEA